MPIKRTAPILLLISFLALSLLPRPAAGAAPALADLAGHWSEAEVRPAVAEGWVNGYPDGLFRPEGTVSRAEFVKLLAAATHLTPDSETAQALIQAAGSNLPAKPEAVLTDLKGHWLATQGWLKPAVAFGLVSLNDDDGRFEPGRAITRQEIAVMAVRALGLVWPATNAPAGDLGFKDQSRLPVWARGYVKQAVQAAILNGYPDGTFGGDRSATRAEAVVIVRRVLAAMAAGADPGIRVYVKAKADQEPTPVALAVPARFIAGRVYVPARSVFQALGRPVRWDPAGQRLTAGLAFTAGSDVASQPLQTSSVDRRMTVPARAAFGELLLPVRMAGSDSSPFFRTGLIFWEPDAKRLTLYAIDFYD